MAPLVWGERATMNQMLWYTVILVAITIMPVTFGAFGVIYFASAVVLGLLLLRGILRMRAAKEWTTPAWWVYKYSLLYLALLFAAMVADRKIPL
jgi:protoheme IX farnesyltransferase